MKTKNPILPSMGIEPGPLITSDSKSNPILSGLTWHVLLRRSLNFCSCTTGYLDLDDSESIKQFSIERKVLDLESEVMRGPGFYSHWG